MKHYIVIGHLADRDPEVWGGQAVSKAAAEAEAERVAIEGLSADDIEDMGLDVEEDGFGPEWYTDWVLVSDSPINVL